MMLEPLLDPTTLGELSARWASGMIVLAGKGLLILAITLGASWLLRRRAAAARHLAWNLAVIAMLTLPVVSTLLPGVDVRGLPAPEITTASTESPVEFGAGTMARPLDAEPARVEWLRARAATQRELARVPSVAPAQFFFRPDASATDVGLQAVDLSTWNALLRDARQWSPTVWALLTWESGVLLVLGWLMLGWVHAERLRRRCRPVEEADWRLLAHEVAGTCGLRRAPRLLWSDEALTPLTLGLWRPAVALPRQAEDWSVDQRHDVLLHEFAHVQRRDILTQVLAQLACAIFWFHPLPWIAAGRMRLERERACDDRVLMAGSRASTYAGHLLEMARSLRLESSLATTTVAMARRSQLGERMESLLDHRERDRAIGRTARGAAFLLALLLLLPLAALRPAAAQAPAPEAPEPQEQPESPTASVAPASPRVYQVVRNRPPHVHRTVDETHGTSVSVDGDVAEDLGDYTLIWDMGHFQFREDDHRLSIEGNGKMRFLPDLSDLQWMEDGAFFEIDERSDGQRRRMTFDGRGDAGIERRFRLDGEEQAIDADVGSWVATSLETFFDHSAVLCRSLVDGWVAEGGLDLALEELDDVRPWALVSYGVAVLRHTETYEDRERVAETILERMGSDHLRSVFLQRSRDEFLVDEPSLLLWIDLTDEIDSDFERARALGTVVSAPGATGRAVALSLQAAKDLQSDFEQGRVLIGVAEMDGLGEEVFLAALEAADELQSDFEKSRALIALIPHLENSEERLDRFYEVADEMGSDFEYRKVLRALRAAGHH